MYLNKVSSYLYKIISTLRSYPAKEGNTKRKYDLPRANVTGSNDSWAGPTCSAREIVLHVQRGLNTLAELDHHYVGHGIPVLNSNRAIISSFFWPGGSCVMFFPRPIREDTQKKSFFSGRTTKVLPSLHKWPCHFFFFIFFFCPIIPWNGFRQFLFLQNFWAITVGF